MTEIRYRYFKNLLHPPTEDITISNPQGLCIEIYGNMRRDVVFDGNEFLLASFCFNSSEMSWNSEYLTIENLTYNAETPYIKFSKNAGHIKKMLMLLGVIKPYGVIAPRSVGVKLVTLGKEETFDINGHLSVFDISIKYGESSYYFRVFVSDIIQFIKNELFDEEGKFSGKLILPDAI